MYCQLDISMITHVIWFFHTFHRGTKPEKKEKWLLLLVSWPLLLVMLLLCVVTLFFSFCVVSSFCYRLYGQFAHTVIRLSDVITDYIFVFILSEIYWTRRAHKTSTQRIKIYTQATFSANGQRDRVWVTVSSAKNTPKTHLFFFFARLQSFNDCIGS